MRLMKCYRWLCTSKPANPDQCSRTCSQKTSMVGFSLIWGFIYGLLLEQSSFSSLWYHCFERWGVELCLLLRRWASSEFKRKWDFSIDKSACRKKKCLLSRPTWETSTQSTGWKIAMRKTFLLRLWTNNSRSFKSWPTPVTSCNTVTWWVKFSRLELH